MGIIDNLAMQQEECLTKLTGLSNILFFPYAMSGGHCSRKGSTVRRIFYQEEAISKCGLLLWANL
jgi:hypothetical protein